MRLIHKDLGHANKFTGKRILVTRTSQNNFGEEEGKPTYSTGVLGHNSQYIKVTFDEPFKNWTGDMTKETTFWWIDCEIDEDGNY